MSIKEQIQTLLPANFSDQSKVWVYQSSRPFSDKQVEEVNMQLEHFYLQWQVHGQDLHGWAGLLFNRFVVFMAEEEDIYISGCSLDTTQRVLKSLERQYDTTLFDRLSITFLVNDKPEVLPMGQVQYALDHGHVKADTPLFNNLVTTKKELLENWLQPLNESWLARQINFG